MKNFFILGIGAALGAGATMVVNVYLPQQATAVPVETVYPVSWWKENGPERIAKVAECKDNPGEVEPNCVNALKADSVVTWKGNGTPLPSLLEVWKQ